MVDKRTLEKYEREAKEKNRETWYEFREDSSTLPFTTMKLVLVSVPGFLQARWWSCPGWIFCGPLV